MTNEYFVTHGAGCIPCDSISRENEDGTFEEITYNDIVRKLNEYDDYKKRIESVLTMYYVKLSKQMAEAVMEPIMYKSLELQRYIILELAIEFGVDLNG